MSHAAPVTDSIIIERGHADDYAALARYHYRAGRPARPVHILRARDADTGSAVGVLTISMPTLNATWRQLAWPQTFASLSAKQNAEAVNRHLRTISRLIVEPRYRALGIARRLVRAYLDEPLTRYTEALAAMGHCCPVFERAGMREVAAPRSQRDLAFGAVLTMFNLHPSALVEVSRAASCLHASPALRAAVREWAMASKGTRAHLCAPSESPSDLDVLVPLAALAGASLTARPRIYIAGD